MMEKRKRIHLLLLVICILAASVLGCSERIRVIMAGRDGVLNYGEEADESIKEKNISV